MPFRITLRYGDFSITHEDEMETGEAMKTGVYASAMHFGTSKMVQMMESKLLTEDPDIDREVSDLVDREQRAADKEAETETEEESPDEDVQD